jgi:hypothetical protein
VPGLWWADEEEADYLQIVRETFLSVEKGRFVGLDAFLHFHRERNNPLLRDSLAGRLAWYESGYPGSAGEYDRRYWNDLLFNFLRLRLLPLGGIEAGVTAEGETCFTLTGAGEYLLGAARDVELVPTEKKEIVVQPDFEIVFLAPAPRAEAELVRIAERRGKGIGPLFRITRPSVLKAAAAGMSAEEVLGLLEANASNPVPENVAHEVRNWMGRYRKAEIRRTLVIECPDPATADRIRSAAGGSVTALSPTHLELLDPKKKGILVRKLKEEGVFL